ncbi:polynucleotide 5'-hydroxyl-kinase NOL9 isoform X2 [Henckelia pumila]|uniref:polynucleotide 5'-hydroxyl-kinase NOL9 isoform X2 n=1 Tax=Henckelia pumila TaxID=405737 RepID=UPI003C6DDC04
MSVAQEIETPSSSIIMPQEWSDATESIVNNSVSSNPPIAIVCGPNNCGKTTFSLSLVNALLQRHKKVAYLDTDVGQAVFTPPGLLSLTVIDEVTPYLTRPCLKTPERCFFFGDISSKRDPEMYLSYIFKLFDRYLKEYSTNNNKNFLDDAGFPLVINTPGWVKGIGYEILVDMIKYMSPTHVVKIKISREMKNLPAGVFWTREGVMDSNHVIEINTALQDHLHRSLLVQKDASGLRDLRVIEYFRQCFPNQRNLTRKKLGLALVAHPPYEFHISSVKIKHLHCEVHETEIFYSLNATIVGLAISSDATERLPQCVGLGIVRAVDPSKGSRLYFSIRVSQCYQLEDPLFRIYYKV